MSALSILRLANGRKKNLILKRFYVIFVLSVMLPLLVLAQQRQKVALVLGGGGAKGAAEVGVLKYVEKSGVPIDFVVGTSIGSIVGGLYSVGYRSEQLDSMFRSQEWISLLTDKRNGGGSGLSYKEGGVNYVLGVPLNLNFKKKERRKGGRGLGALRGDSIVSTLERMISRAPQFSQISDADSVDFDSLPIPFRCVAVDIEHFDEVYLDHGNIASAMRASMAIPLAFKPMKIDGMTLVDGGVLNNLPVDVAKAMGADIIIAVDLTVNKHEKKSDKFFDYDDSDGGVFEPIRKLGVLNYVKWGVERPDVKKYKENVKLADIYINPDLKGYGPQSFSVEKIAQMIAIGEEAGRKSLGALKKLNRKIKKNK